VPVPTSIVVVWVGGPDAVPLPTAIAVRNPALPASATAATISHFIVSPFVEAVFERLQPFLALLLGAFPHRFHVPERGQDAAHP
jgi:hypothetical protein